MNYKLTIRILGVISDLLAIACFISLGFALVQHESITIIYMWSGMIVCLGAIGISNLIARYVSKKIDTTKLNAKTGFVTLGISWVFASLVGAIPFMFYKIPGIENYADAFFESASAFSGTGASLAINADTIPQSLQIFRGISQWLGGMGIVVLITALLGKDESMSSPIFNAEMPGPSKGKLVSKSRVNARILYLIYIALTVGEFLALYIGSLIGTGATEEMSAFDCVFHSLTTTATGGFSTKQASIGAFGSLYYEIVICVFMFLCMANFNLYFIILKGGIKNIIQDEELRTMFILMVVNIFAISGILFYENFYPTFAEALRYGSFQVISTMSTTGYATKNLLDWPAFAKVLLLGMMFIGGSAGSTSGGLKMSRFIILMKSGFRGIKTTAFPNRVISIRMSGKPVETDLSHSIRNYFLTYVLIYIFSLAIVVMLTPGEDFLDLSISVASCFNNNGPGVFANMHWVTKLVLAFDMLAGRLELFPILLLFMPKAWKRF